ncbi:lysophospholipid acyltransferase family protein [Phormidium sp. CCY1219]|uniref:lysophospholipid acyltransferase family protein n=1 Tax=Phormidium sp. CCY1219 TaxID=2886104 RepID=UPI002D1E94CD|nr:lysophospholipid acyltransferase family protein [Phormidium sp. CCY1219]MEB3829623.1 1-acyl-sn-glycerol-3-phosphate acyltransferase [Phormidium sp. CCY1219]
MVQSNSRDNSQTHKNLAEKESSTSRIAPWIARLVYPLFRYLVLPFYFDRIEVKGRENVPEGGPVILAPTHRSRWDALLIGYAAGRDITGRDLRFMVSADEMQGLQGWFIRRLGGFPVNPKHPGISSLRHGIELLENKEMLVIFPEGRIFHTQEVQPIEPGFARLALQAESNNPGLGVKIVPMSLSYHPPIPHWRSAVEVAIGEPLVVDDYCKKPPKECSKYLKADLKAALERVHEERLKAEKN